MLSIDELGEMLDEISKEIPEAFYRELNGGILLTPEEKIHPESRGGQHLYILGEYHNDRKGYGGLGRYIIIYYGSFIRLYAHSSPKQQREELRKVVIHEFTHHLESLAGERELEIKDEIAIQRYKGRFVKKSYWRLKNEKH
jgi:predicted Zn-dependent protease with MMP-like domain